MTEDLELNQSKTKLPQYEPIDAAVTPSRRRRLAYFLGVVAVVLTIVVISVFSTPSTPSANTDSDHTAAGPATKSMGVCPLTPGSTVSRPITVAGVAREYKVIVPDGIVWPASAIFAYHGISSDTATIEGKMKLADFQRDNAEVKSLLVYPEAKNKGSKSLFDPAAFNGAACCKNAADFNDEETFEAIVNELTDLGCINSDKVNALGFSNGGFMTHRLACAERTKSKLAAACVHSGLIGDYSGDLTKSPWKVCDSKPIMAIHGTSDSTVPFAGGKNPLGASRWFSFDQTMAIWASGCSAPTEETVGSKTTKKSACGTHSVISISYTGFGHEWHADSTRDCMAFFNDNGSI